MAPPPPPPRHRTISSNANTTRRILLAILIVFAIASLLYNNNNANHETSIAKILSSKSSYETIFMSKSNSSKTPPPLPSSNNTTTTTATKKKKKSTTATAVEKEKEDGDVDSPPITTMVIAKSKGQRAPKFNKAQWDYKQSVYSSSTTAATDDGDDDDDDTNVDDTDYFSACLLIADDNQRLPEWIAYHYYALKLRYLVVAVDPNSHASPHRIFQRWGKHTNLTIVLWNPIDPELMKNSKSSTTKTEVLPKKDQLQLKHTYQLLQKGFYYQCTKHLLSRRKSRRRRRMMTMRQNNNNTTTTRRRRTTRSSSSPATTRPSMWTTYSDIDEYLTMNGDVITTTTMEESSQPPGFILKIIKELTSTTKTKTALSTGDGEKKITAGGISNTLELESSLPPEILLLLQQYGKKRKKMPNWYKRMQQFPCIPLPRVLFSAYESTADEIYRDIPYDWINASKYETLRWRYRAWWKRAKMYMPPRSPKSVVDLSQISLEQYEESGGMINAHYPFGEGICPGQGSEHYKPPEKYNESAPIAFHHYLGGWESYNCRDDTRADVNPNSKQFAHNYKKWKKTAFEHSGGSDDVIRPWIKGFVKYVGEDAAKLLLDGVGDYSHCTSPRV